MAIFLYDYIDFIRYPTWSSTFKSMNVGTLMFFSRQTGDKDGARVFPLIASKT